MLPCCYDSAKSYVYILPIFTFRSQCILTIYRRAIHVLRLKCTILDSPIRNLTLLKISKKVNYSRTSLGIIYKNFCKIAGQKYIYFSSYSRDKKKGKCYHL